MTNDDFCHFAGAANGNSLEISFIPGKRMNCLICEKFVTSEEIRQHISTHLGYDRKTPNAYIEKLIHITLEDQWIHNSLPPDCLENVVDDRWCYYRVCCRSGSKMRPFFNDAYTPVHMVGLQQMHQSQVRARDNTLAYDDDIPFTETAELHSVATFDVDQEYLDIRGNLGEHANEVEAVEEHFVVEAQMMDTNRLQQSISDENENNFTPEDNEEEKSANHNHGNEHNIDEEDEADYSHAGRKESARQRLSTAFRYKQEIREREGLEPIKLILTVGRDQCRDPYNECGGKLVGSNHLSRLAHVNSEHLKLVRYICRLCERKFTCINTTGINRHLKCHHKILDKNERESKIDYGPFNSSNLQIRQKARDVFFPGLSLHPENE